MRNKHSKVALVTGGARRIGAQLCRTLHQAGYNIALHYLNSEDDAMALATELNNQNDGSVACFQALLGTRSASESLAKEVISHFGHVNLLVNNIDPNILFSSFYLIYSFQLCQKKCLNL